MVKFYMINTQDGNHKFAGESRIEAESYAEMAGFEIVNPTEWAEVVVGNKRYYENILTGEIVFPAEDVKPNYYFDAIDYITWANKTYGADHTRAM